jgi:hypothetical protein
MRIRLACVHICVDTHVFLIQTDATYSIHMYSYVRTCIRTSDTYIQFIRVIHTDNTDHAHI